MKIIGLLGGMSWESAVPYYRHINEAVKSRLGSLHSAIEAAVDTGSHGVLCAAPRSKSAARLAEEWFQDRCQHL